MVNLGKCALNLLGKTTVSDKDLVMPFCCMTLSEYIKSPIKDQVYKVTGSHVLDICINNPFTRHPDKILNADFPKDVLLTVRAAGE